MYLQFPALFFTICSKSKAIKRNQQENLHVFFFPRKTSLKTSLTTLILYVFIFSKFQWGLARPHETLYDLGSLISVENPPNAGRNTCPRLGSAGAPVLGAPSAPSMAREPRCPTSSVQPHLSVKPHLFDPPPPFRRRPAASAVQVLADDLIAPRGQTFSGTSCTSAAPMDVRCPNALA